MNKILETAEKSTDPKLSKNIMRDMAKIAKMEGGVEALMEIAKEGIKNPKDLATKLKAVEHKMWVEAHPVRAAFQGEGKIVEGVDKLAEKLGDKLGSIVANLKANGVGPAQAVAQADKSANTGMAQRRGGTEVATVG